MSETFFIGLDIGNATIKAYEGYRRRWLAHNVVDDRCDASLKEGHTRTADSWLDIEIMASPVLAAVPSARYYFGQLAVERNGSPRPLVTNKLREAHTALVLVMTLLRTAAHRLESMKKAERAAFYDDAKGRYVLHFEVGSGAPIHQFEDTEAKRLYASRVKGSHVGRFVTTPGYDTLGPIEVVVDLLNLGQEGIGAMADYRYDDNGAQRRRGDLDCWTATIDIGANTLDYATVNKEGGVEPLLTKGLNVGLADALDQLKDAINVEFGREYSRPQLVEEFTQHGFSIPKTRKEREDVEAMAGRYLRRVTDEVANVVRKLIKDSQNRIGLVLIAGGGAALLRPFLEPILADLRGVDVEFLDNPIHANAAGYYKRLMVKRREAAAKAAGGNA